MKHLAPKEMVDLIEGTLANERAAHLDTCPDCRHQAEELRAVMGQARQVDIPEPSPLFWEHLSSRVHDAVAAASGPRSDGWWARWSVSRAALVATVGMAVLALVVGSVMFGSLGRDALVGGDLSRSDQVVGDVGSGSAGQANPVDEEPGWALVLSVAAGIEWEETDEEGLFIAPGAAERAVLQLSTDERRELARLLQAELAP